MASRRRVRSLAIVATMSLASGLLTAQTVSTTDAGGLELRGLHGGDAPVAARFSVREWGRREIAKSTTTATENNTVGSIVEIEAPAGEGLPLVADSWDRAWATQAEPADDATRITQTLDGDWRLEATLRSVDGAIEARGRLVNLQPSQRPERPVTLALSIELPDTEGYDWLRNSREREPLDGAGELIETVPTTAGAVGTMSRYPFGAVAKGDAGLAMGFPLGEPRIQRLRWDGRRGAMMAEVDVAVSSMPRAFTNEVPFAFIVYGFDGARGFRHAAQRYHALNATSYDKRLTRQGQWMPFTQVDTVARVEDFAFQFHEYHPNVSVAYNTANGIESLVYCEPPVQYVNLSADQPRDLALLNTMIDRMTTIQGSQLRTSTTRDRDGAMPVAWVVTPWATGGRVPTNGNPDIARGDNNTHNSFDANWLPYLDLYRRVGDDAPRAWSGGRRVDGALGMTGKALVLAAGESTSQRVQLESSDTAPLLVMKVSSSTNGMAKLTVRLADESTDVEVIADGAAVRREVPLSKSPLPPGAYTLTLTAGDADIAIDDLALMGGTIDNASFEDGALDNEAVTGVYLDSFEGWDSPQLNFRREHLEATRLPLTFDAQTGATAQVVMMHNFELAGEMLRRLRARGHVLMGNTALYQWSWSAHFLDVLGIETSWGETERIAPPRLDELDFLRTMLYHKPYCYLQNVQYANFRGDKVRDYFALCMQFGLWPGFFSHNAAESPYWQDPALYNDDRVHFLTYMRPQQRLTAAGWEPVTLATTSDARLLVERWGGGPLVDGGIDTSAVHFTCYNPTTAPIAFELAIEQPARAAEPAIAFDLLTGDQLLVGKDGEVRGLHLAPSQVAAIAVLPLRADAIEQALVLQREDIDFLVEKYRRFGFIDASTANEQIAARIEALYQPEWERSTRLLAHLVRAQEQVSTARFVVVDHPPSLIVGAPSTFAFKAGPAPKESTVLVVEGAGNTLRVPFVDGRAQVIVPSEWRVPTALTRVESSNGARVVFEGVFPIEERVAWGALPERLIVRRDSVVSLALHNNSDDEIVANVKAEAPMGVAVSGAGSITIAPMSEQAVELRLVDEEKERADDLKSVLRLSVDVAGEQLARAEVPATILAANANKLRGPGVSVRVDSHYFGYDHKALTDGIVDPAGAGWSEVAWASGDGHLRHWAEFSFDEPHEISEVKIHWAIDGGTTMTSREVLVQVIDGAGECQTVATHSASEAVPVSTLAFAPRATSRLRLYQPAGAGPVSRPGLMWLMEVEAR